MKLTELLCALSLLAPFACAKEAETTIPDSDASAPDQQTQQDSGSNGNGGNVEDSSDAGAMVADAGDASVDTDASDGGGCSPSGFCPTTLIIGNPQPPFYSFPNGGRQALTPAAIAGTGPNDVWVVAYDWVTFTDMRILRWDGGSWKDMYRLPGSQVNTHAQFFAIQASQPNNVWALTQREIVRYSSLNGEPPAFRRESLPAGQLGGNGDDRGELDDSFPNNLPGGGTWLEPAGDALWIANRMSIVRLSEDSGGSLIGQVFSPALGNYTWTGLWGASPTDVYASGYLSRGNAWIPAVLAHYNGVAWSVTEVSRYSGTEFLYLWGVASEGKTSKLFATSGGQRLDVINVTTDGVPTAVTEVPAPSSGACSVFSSGHFTSATSGWVSLNCLLYQWNGSGLTPVTTAIGGASVGKINGIWADASGDTWVVGAAPTTCITQSGGESGGTVTQCPGGAGFALRRHGN